MKMDWERKFYDIVQETETNLANARRKLRANCLEKTQSKKIDYHDPSKHATTSFQPSVSSFVNNNDHINAIRRQMGWSLTSTQQPSPQAGSTPHELPSSGTMELQMKIESQRQMIEKLEELVKTLNQEKNQYCRQIRDLQNEVGNISERMNESRATDPYMESQVNLMRKEVRADVHRLQDLIAASKSPPLYTNCFERSLKYMQQNVHAELEELRRDLNVVMQRVGKLELDVSTHSISQRDRHEKLNRSAENASTGSQLGASGSILRRQPFPLTPGDIFQMKELRSTVSRLHDKLDSLEDRVTASQISPPTPLSSYLVKGFGKKLKSHRPSVKMYDDFDAMAAFDSNDLDDLDLPVEFDLDIPENVGGLDEDFDVNVGFGNTRPVEIKASVAPDLISNHDDTLSDDIDMILGVGREKYKQKGPSPEIKLKLPQRKNDTGTTSVEHRQLSSHRLSNDITRKADVLFDPDIDNLDVDSGSDPVELDSLDEL